MSTETTPDTLLGAITYFADVDVATMFVASLLLITDLGGLVESLISLGFSPSSSSTCCDC